MHLRKKFRPRQILRLLYFVLESEDKQNKALRIPEETVILKASF